MKYLVTAVAVSTILAAGAAGAQGIPVYDNTSFLQLVQSVTQLKAQLTQLESTYNAMTGSRGMGGLINNPAARQYLPADYQSVLSSVSTGAGDLSSLAKQILSNNSVLSTDQLSALSPENQKWVNQQRNQAASQGAAAQMAFQQASQRFSTLQTLIDSINSQTDPKAIQDLQARIQAESVMLQNERAKLDSMASANAVQQQLDEQREREQALRFINTKPPSFKTSHD
jgi:type IV secretion system protein VirB5